MTNEITDRTHLRAYDRRRRRSIKNGTWQRPVSVTQIRQHVRLLNAAGMSLTAVANAANLSPATVYPIINTDQRHVQGATAAALLAVQPPDVAPLPAGMVDATGTARRLQALVAIGYSISDLSRRLGYKNMQQVWEWTRRRQSALHEVGAAKVAALFEALWDTPGPSRRARNDAVRNEWLPPLAWGDDIDDPNAVPDLGAAGDDIVDDEMIRRVLAGDVPFHALSDAEKVALFRDHLDTWGYKRIRDAFGLHVYAIDTWRARAAEQQVAA